ncbi:deoxyribodipyrimidine photo-lyase [Bacillus sp. FJAT-45350]|uniref:deoxyribodipyrimidine photo-lyase n=1 Tax=Bacillus sp. FJAT-45350 TaxID=2011014 RepID=UPI00359C293D
MLVTSISNLTRVYFNEDKVGRGAIRDTKARNYFSINNIEVHSFFDAHLVEPESVVKKDGTPYKVFTPYYRDFQHI